MKILKKGSTAMKFICNKCNTIFEAEKEECKPVVHTAIQRGTYDNYDYKVGCPLCGATVFHVIGQ